MSMVFILKSQNVFLFLFVYNLLVVERKKVIILKSALHEMFEKVLLCQKQLYQPILQGDTKALRLYFIIYFIGRLSNTIS